MFNLNWIDALVILAILLLILAGVIYLARQVVRFLRRKMRVDSTNWDERMLKRE